MLWQCCLSTTLLHTCHKVVVTVTNSFFYNDSNRRYGHVDILILLLVHLLHRLLHSWIMRILEDLGEFSTGRHPMPPFSKEPMINCKSCFHPLATSHQPHCLLPHGTEWQHMEEDPRYVSTYATICTTIRYSPEVN